jgi:apolipoprotein N-acyltransferase
MKRTHSPWVSRIFILAFLVLTFFCWCPLFYGSYGPARRIAGVPIWAVVAAVFGAGLFALEWIYLFATRITVSDEDLERIVSELAQVNIDEADSGKEEE